MEGSTRGEEVCGLDYEGRRCPRGRRRPRPSEGRCVQRRVRVAVGRSEVRIQNEHKNKAYQYQQSNQREMVRNGRCEKESGVVSKQMKECLEL
eukprot:6175844-Pleurochrysis_carterae.AAC.6